MPTRSPRGSSSRSSRGGGAARGGSGGRGGRGGNPRPYQRTARVNESLREVVAEALEEIDDERLGMVTVTGIEVDPDFGHGVVFYSALFTNSDPQTVQEAFDEHRVRLQAAVAREVRLKRTPLLSFRVDPAITAGVEYEDLRRTLPSPIASPIAESDNEAE